MKLSRMDLDGSGSGSPRGLVAKILKAEPGLTVPVPIEDLARQLDIKEIRDVETEGFVGALITDAPRSNGFILVQKGLHRVRRRFTIGHEVCHFLMTSHKPPPDGFRCSSEDMRRWADKSAGGLHKMEVEANEFASLILMPPPLWRAEMAKFGEPEISQITALAKKFDVSKEAAARNYADYHDECVAIVVVNKGAIDKVYRNMSRFPKLAAKRGDAVPKSSLYHRAPGTIGLPSMLDEARPEAWLESEWGKPLPSLYEQVLLQQNGFAMVMLWAEAAEDDEGDGWGEKTSKQRLQEQQSRWRA